MSRKTFRSTKEGLTIIIGAIMLFFGILFWSDIRGMFSGSQEDKTEKKIKKDKKDKTFVESEINKGENSQSPEVADIKILERWDLPKELKEVSGIAHLGNGKFACVQDEKGIVFIYDISTSKLERQIPFSGLGDFEGITAVGQSLYVIRADGKLFHIENMNSSSPSVKEYDTGLTVKNNIESLCYDRTGNRLLLTGKDKDPEGADQKRIYSYDIPSKKLNSSPIFSINLNNELLGSGKKGIQPSAIGIHPVSSNIYIIDGPAAKLIVLDPKGGVRNVYSLDSKELPQAEGISFEENGTIYISTEGDKTGAIVEVSVPNP